MKSQAKKFCCTSQNLVGSPNSLLARLSRCRTPSLRKRSRYDFSRPPYIYCLFASRCVLLYIAKSLTVIRDYCSRERLLCQSDSQRDRLHVSLVLHAFAKSEHSFLVCLEICVAYINFSNVPSSNRRSRAKI